MEKLVERILKEIKMNQESSDFYKYEMHDDLTAAGLTARAGTLIYCLMSIYTYDQIQEMLQNV